MVECIVIGETTLPMLVSSRKQGKWCLLLEHLPSTVPWKRSVTPSLLLLQQIRTVPQKDLDRGVLVRL